MKRILTILFILLSVELHAQLVQVSGYIYARSDSSVSLPNVAIINKRTKSGTQSSADGFYSILMAPGDTVEVSLLGYKSMKFGMPSNVTISYYHKNVYLKDEYVILKGYTAKDKLTWKKFTEVFTAMAPEKEKEYIILDKQQLDKSPVNAQPHLALNGPISWLYGKLSRKAKELDKLEDLKNGENLAYTYSSRITDEYVMKATKLPKEQVKPFLDYCNLDLYFYAQSTDYDIQTKFNEYLPGFLEHYNGKDSPPKVDPAATDTVKTDPK